MNPARRMTAAAATALVLATTGGLLGALATPASAATGCASPVYTRKFFANTNFSGTPKKTDCDSAIDQDWGTGAPFSGLPKDGFGVRWTVTRDFGSGGPFAVTASGTDGIRVYLDGGRQIDLWSNTAGSRSKSRNLTIPRGKHTLRIDYVNWTGAAKVKFTYAPRTSATYDKTAPLAPAGLNATYAADTQQTKLTWPKNAEMDLAGYRVYRQVAGSGAWRQLSSGTTATSYTDVPPATGDMYEYIVTAYDKAGNDSAQTARATVTSFAVTVPTGFTATGTDSGIALAWDQVPGAVHYRVVRKADGEPSIYWVPTGTSLTDTGVARSAEYKYQVAAVDVSGRITAYTPLKAARRLVAAPASVQAFPRRSAVTLTWRMDDKTAGDYVDFRVYRTGGASTGRVEVTDRCDTWRRTLADGTVQHLCTDYSAGENTAYRYVVKAYDKAGTESIAGAEVAATTGTDAQAPAAPASATAAAEDWGTVVTWAPVTDADLYQYSVLRGTTVVDGDSVSCSDAVHIGYADAGATSYQDVGPADGEKLCYVVKAVDFAGNVGGGATAHTVEHDLTPTVETPAGATHMASASVWSTGTVHVDMWSPAGTETYGSARFSRWNPQTGTFDALPESEYTSVYDHDVPTGTTLWYQVSGVRADGTTSLPVLVSVAVPPVS
ncbi:fibronectin type III domain-containing protein [Streptomyces sp. NPDC086549]|uniref:fibronectin type III domain-containing protein n=1 Tax=Streptomyces sp. NPDC086549 TaxID=3365752 RepID=UPI00381A77C5